MRLGWFDAALVAAMFAATYPERVSALILGGLWLTALAGRPETLTPDPDVAKIYADGIESGWRHGVDPLDADSRRRGRSWSLGHVTVR